MPQSETPAIPVVEQDKTLPLPGWLVKVYFIFPIVLYIPDAIFNYFVYSDGLNIPRGNIVLQVAQITLWGFMSIGVVGMAYLLSVLAPWHWGQGHRIQALFCALGVVVATAITTWNSLAFRSTGFKEFPTDVWAQQAFPQLTQLRGFSLTMILVAIAPPFWGLFWAVVQPTQTGRSLRQLQESHQERLLRLQQEAELKRVKADANAKVRAAQLRGLALTATAAREQAAEVFARKPAAAVESAGESGTVTVTEVPGDQDDGAEDSSGELPAVGRVLPLPVGKLPAGRNEASFHNHAAAATPAVHSAPAGGLIPAAAQPHLLREADVQPASTAAASASGDPSPWAPRKPAVPGGGIIPAFFPDESMTGTPGPRPAVRRPGDNNVRFRSITGDLSPAGMAAVQQAIEELRRERGPDSANKSIVKKELVARVMQRQNMDEAGAQRLVDQWYREYKDKKSGRSGNR